MVVLRASRVGKELDSVSRNRSTCRKRVATVDDGVAEVDKAVVGAIVVVEI